MKFLEIPGKSWSRWTDFSGRASRSEYWFNLLWWWLLLWVFLIVGSSLGLSAGLGVAYVYLSAILILPAAIRRLHDLNASGWLMLLNLLPLAGLFFFFWFMRKGTNGPNKYGEDPTTSN